MASTNPANVPSSISIPSGAPRDILGVAMFLTQLVTQLNAWMARVANSLNSVNASAITKVVAGAGIGVTSSANEAVVKLLTPVAAGLGGTGHTSYTDGELLIGNSANGLTAATLTAGSGCTITNGDGAITIAATGSGGTITSVVAGTGLSGGGSSGAVTVSLATPVSVAHGGTNVAAASGTALDNITGFSSTGVLQRTGAGTYSFIPAFQDNDWTFSSHSMVGNLNSSASPTAVVPGVVLNGADGGNIGFEAHAFLNGGTPAAFLVLTAAGGTDASKSALGSGARIGGMIFSGYDGSAYAASFPGLVAFTGSAWTASNHQTQLRVLTITSGSTTTQNPAIFADGLLLPGGVSGGDQGSGTVNASTGYYVGGTKQIRTVAAPAHNTSTGVAGDCAWDSGFFYICTAANTWARVAIGGTW